MTRFRLFFSFAAFWGSVSASGGAWAQAEAPAQQQEPPAAPPAQPEPPAPAQPAQKGSSNLVNFKNPIKEINLEVTVRHRLEYWGNYDFDFSVHDNHEYINQQIRLSLEAVVSDKLKGFVQIQDARSWGSAGLAVLQGVYTNLPLSTATQNTIVSFGGTTDIHQGYVWAELWDTGISLQIGRAEWNYGDQRVIGPLAWSMIGRSFDGARLRWNVPEAQVDVLYSRLVENATVNPAGPNPSLLDVQFFGVYSTVKILGFLPFDFYWLMLVDDRDRPGEAPGTFGSTEFHTLGLRIVKKIPVDSAFLDLGTEGDYQIGRLNGASLYAYAIHVHAGVGSDQWPLKPVLLYQFDYASGDPDRTDGEVNTFQQLFPTSHLFHGFMDLFARQNLVDSWLGLYLTPADGFKASIHWHFLQAAQGTDAAYRANGVPMRIPPPRVDGGTDFGNEIDLLMDYQVSNYWALQFGACYFFTGSYFRNVPNPGSPGDDVYFFYLQSLFTF